MTDHRDSNLASLRSAYVCCYSKSYNCYSGYR